MNRNQDVAYHRARSTLLPPASELHRLQSQLEDGLRMVAEWRRVHGQAPIEPDEPDFMPEYGRHPGGLDAYREYYRSWKARMAQWEKVGG